MSLSAPKKVSPIFNIDHPAADVKGLTLGGRVAFSFPGGSPSDQRDIETVAWIDRTDDEVSSKLQKKPYDATTRGLIEMGPAEWADYLGSRAPDPGRVRAIDSNLSTVTAEADKVLWIEAPDPWIEHVELQGSRDVRLVDRGHLYSTLLEYQYRVPIRSSLVLLRPAADGPELTGLRERKHRNGDVYDQFRYSIIRVWEQPVSHLLTCGLTVLPLAPISKVEPEKISEVLQAISERLIKEASPDQAATLWNATRILMGLRYKEEQIDAIFEGVPAMLFGIHGIEESSVYQGIFRKGETKGIAEGLAEGLADGLAKGAVLKARKILLHQGSKKLGPPDERIAAEIASLDDVDRLDDLLDRVLDVSTWDELLASPAR
jgi:predicted transposase YdaD